jgi:hypothetical protein
MILSFLQKTNIKKYNYPTVYKLLFIFGSLFFGTLAFLSFDKHIKYIKLVVAFTFGYFCIMCLYSFIMILGNILLDNEKITLKISMFSKSIFLKDINYVYHNDFGKFIALVDINNNLLFIETQLNGFSSLYNNLNKLVPDKFFILGFNKKNPGESIKKNYYNKQHYIILLRTQFEKLIIPVCLIIPVLMIILDIIKDLF